MQTKSPLVRIAGIAGLILAILASIFSLKIQHHAHSSSSLASNHTAVSTQPATALSAAQKQDFTTAYGKLALAFETNHGQTDPAVRYLAHGRDYQLFLTNHEAVMTLRQPSAAASKKATSGSLLAARAHRETHAAAKTSVLRMHFDGANPATEIAGSKLLPGKTNYFIGNDPKKWHTDIPSYEAVRYQGIYPGVDLLFYGHQQQLEYDFIVAPGADSQAIALSITGAHKLEISAQGDVLMSIAGGKVALQRPAVYQVVNGERREIAGNYSIASDHQIRFSVAPYDHTQPLTIDPILNYSTYVGGEGTDVAFGLALDASGNAYIAGDTTSTSFPQVNALGGAPGDIGLDTGTVFVSELNPGGTALLYSTYVGGSGNGSFGEGADAIALDSASPPNIYVTGFTGSPDFPTNGTVPAAQATAPPSAATGGAAFITKLAPSAPAATQLVYSSYLGGDTFDEGHSIAVDANGIAYIAGETISTDYPTHGTQISTGLTSPAGNAFLTEINTTTTGALVYSTYLGGSSAGTNFLGFGDIAYGIAIDTSLNAYVVGGTSSTDFPTAGTAIAGSAACGVNTNGSAFISKITPTGTLLYSHCLSGNSAEVALGVSLGTGVPAIATKVAYVTGTTSSSNFPVTAGSIPPPGGGVANGVVFVSLVNPVNGALQYSTFLGGTNSDNGYAISSDSLGNVYVTGATGSADFPVTQGALQVARNNANGAGFLAMISPNGSGLADLDYSTYFGGAGNNSGFPDTGEGVVVAGSAAYIAGRASSPATGTNPFPVTSGSFQTSLNGSTNAYIAAFALPLQLTISVSPSAVNFGTQLQHVASLPKYVTVTNNTASAVTLALPPTTVGPNAADFVGTASGTTPCTTSLAAGASCTIGIVFTPATAAAESGTLQIHDSLDDAGPTPHPMLVALTGTGSASTSNITLTPPTLTLVGALLTTSSAPMTVSIGNNGTTPLTITTISAAPGVFTDTSNTAACNNGAFPIVIAANGPACVVSVTFSPVAATAPGPVSGSLTITQLGGNVDHVPLSGTAWDFSVAAASINVTKGMTGSFPVIVTGLGGFTGSVSFTCTPGSALITSCSVPTTNAAAAPGATANGSITAAAFIVPPQSIKVPPAALLRQVLFIMLAIALLLMLPSARRFRTRFGMLGAMMAFILIAGCSGGTAPPKTTTISITPTSGTVTKTAISVNVTVTQ